MFKYSQKKNFIPKSENYEFFIKMYKNFIDTTKFIKYLTKLVKFYKLC